MKVHLVTSDNASPTGLGNYADALRGYAKKVRHVELEILTPQPALWLAKALFSLLSIDWVTLKKSYPVFLNLPKEGVIHFTNQQQGLSLLFNKKAAQRSVVTVHDVIPLTPIAHYPFFRRLLFKLSMFGVTKAAMILADSEHTKKDLIKYLNINEDRIHVVPLGVDTTMYRPLKIAKKPYSILYVGSEEPRKNFLLLINAFSLLKKKIPQAQLIKVGTAQWPNARQKSFELMEQLGLHADDVVFKGHIKNLAEEYNHAELFVFLSLYEGFGLPVLEAMACGTPVMCSNKTSLPEIGGDAVVYVSGTNERELAEKMYTVLTTGKLKKELREKGLLQAKKFSWEKCVEGTVKVYTTMNVQR